MTLNLTLYLVSVMSFALVVWVYSRGLVTAIITRTMTPVRWVRMGIVIGFVGVLVNAFYWGTENIFELYSGTNALWWDENANWVRYSARPLQLVAAWLHLIAAFIGVQDSEDTKHVTAPRNS